MSRTPAEDPHAFAGPYVLDALSTDERRRFEHHLEGCEACVREVRGFTETTALLGTAAARTPPAEMRERVLRAAAATRQLPPRGSGRTDRAVGPVRRWRRPFTLTLAACLTLILALGAGLVWQSRSMDEMSHREREIAAVLAADDATYSSERFDDATVGAVASREHGMVVVTARGLSDPEDQDYQVWLSAPDGSMRSGGMLDVGEDGTDMMMVTDIGDAREIAITMEPEGGSPRPTSEPMMSVPVGDPG